MSSDSSRLLFLLRAERNLATRGLAAIATISECTRGRSGFGVSYDFQTVDGQSLQGRDTLGSPREAGARVCIVYSPQQPNRSRVYPLGGYRAAG
jgi:hypothetical protein